MRYSPGTKSWPATVFDSVSSVSRSAADGVHGFAGRDGMMLAS
jgi:hypothetical protein